MAQKQLELRVWLIQLALVVLLCSLIAVATQTLWSGPYFMHLDISLTYGVTAITMVYLVTRLWPTLSTIQASMLGVLGSMVLGSWNMLNTLSNTYPGGDMLNQLDAILAMSLLFNVLIFLFFYAHNRHLLAERSLQEAQVVQAESAKALTLSQLKQLQSQMEPHFLFNTLANIDALIDANPSLARHLLQRLNDLLRGTLRGNSQPLIKLSDEMELLNAYLDIQKVRLGERFSYQIESDLGQLCRSELMLPPFLLQPLVENAIIHGIEPSSKKSQVSINFSIDNNQLKVRVRDDGVGLQAGLSSSGHGIGLANVRQRLSGLMQKTAQIKLYQASTGETVAELNMPLGELKRLASEIGPQAETEVGKGAA
jgi:sensor histidine kinase YesM